MTEQVRDSRHILLCEVTGYGCHASGKLILTCKHCEMVYFVYSTTWVPTTSLKPEKVLDIMHIVLKQINCGQVFQDCYVNHRITVFNVKCMHCKLIGNFKFMV